MHCAQVFSRSAQRAVQTDGAWQPTAYSYSCLPAFPPRLPTHHSETVNPIPQSADHRLVAKNQPMADLASEPHSSQASVPDTARNNTIHTTRLSTRNPALSTFMVSPGRAPRAPAP